MRNLKSDFIRHLKFGFRISQEQNEKLKKQSSTISLQTAEMQTKYIFVTGGVCSSLGKGIATASIGALLKASGFKVFTQKLDPYLNVDPGTMNPFQHGEVYVLDDGSETDLDLGHYERFVGENLTEVSSVTTGKIYSHVISEERKGSYLGGTIQIIPHITNAIKKRIKDAPSSRETREI